MKTPLISNLIFLIGGLAVFAGNTLAQDATQLAQSKNCLACHSVDNKIVGPAFKAVAKKYAGNAGAVSMLAGRIMKGSTGVWGQIPMPPNPQVTPEEAKTLATWILAQK